MSKRTLLVACSIALLLLVVSSPAVELVNAERGGYTLTRSVISSGGMGGSASGYTLTSTLGQPIAGSVSGGDFTLTSGFWGQALMAWFENFLPLILR